jgi:hypothetical protein
LCENFKKAVAKATKKQTCGIAKLNNPNASAAESKLVKKKPLD